MKIVIDIGGTNMRVAASKDGVTLVRKIKIPTPTDDPHAGVGELCRIIGEFADGQTIDVLAGGVAGVFDKEKSVLVRSPNIGGWVGFPIKKELQDRLKTKVILENDTAVVGLGEAYYGAGISEGIMAYVTVSTGVGGVRITNGIIDPTTYGFEIGHQYIDVDRSLCQTCPEPGDLESYVSGASLEKRFNKKPYEITDPIVWEEVARFLAVGLTNTIVHWSPEVVVLGGSMITGSPCVEFAHIEKYVRHYLTIFPELPQFRKAQLGDSGGLQGALILLMHEKEQT